MAATTPKKLIIFGANGYVGSTIARIAATSGVTVIAASRSGEGPLRRRGSTDADYAWVDDVQWSRVDATERKDVAEFLDYHGDAAAVITSIGALTLNHRDARRINGDANVNIASAVYERPDIRRMVFISAKRMVPVDKVLTGYYHGKQVTERAMGENLRGRGVALRPGMVSGTRIATSHGLAIPLWVVGTPMEAVFAPLYKLTGLSILAPPSTVEDVARAALFAALQAPVSAETELVEYDGIREMASRFESEALRIVTPAAADAANAASKATPAAAAAAAAAATADEGKKAQ
jgi:nucleoside-diphosphate-sugar epimerase